MDSKLPGNKTSDWLTNTWLFCLVSSCNTAQSSCWVNGQGFYSVDWFGSQDQVVKLWRIPETGITLASDWLNKTDSVWSGMARKITVLGQPGRVDTVRAGNKLFFVSTLSRGTRVIMWEVTSCNSEPVHQCHGHAKHHSSGCRKYFAFKLTVLYSR